jgi:voltage-gated potassium channel Kch
MIAAIQQVTGEMCARPVFYDVLKPREGETVLVADDNGRVGELVDMGVNECQTIASTGDPIHIAIAYYRVRWFDTNTTEEVGTGAVVEIDAVQALGLLRGSDPSVGEY